MKTSLSGIAPSGRSSFVRRRKRGPLVLIVDDGAEARDLYCSYFEFHGFRAVAAEDGAAGIAQAVATSPDVIVLDFSMPKMDGAEVVDRLKKDRRTRAIPIVMLTAVPDLVPARVKAACAAFLEKPCDPDGLLKIIGQLVRWDDRESPSDNDSRRGDPNTARARSRKPH